MRRARARAFHCTAPLDCGRAGRAPSPAAWPCGCRRGRRAGLLRAASAPGQAIGEYAVMVGLAVAAVTGMQLYVRRGLQANIKLTADTLGDQQTGLQYEIGDTDNQRRMVLSGKANAQSRSSSRTISRSRTEEQVTPGGGVTRLVIEDRTETRGGLGGGVADIDESVVER